MRFVRMLAFLFAFGVTQLQSRATDPLTLNKGDHICVVGGTLAERQQLFGWLETEIYSRFPNQELVIRNLGYSGDEIGIRLRSMDFGTPDQWLAGEAPVPQPGKLRPNAVARQNRFELAGTKADVIFAFFGYGESFAGSEGLDAFKRELDGYLKHLQSQKYNGRSAPRVVLFSPIAHEDLRSPNLPNGSENNERLAMYTSAMSEVAKENEVPFVNLFEISKSLYVKARQTSQPLTINGIHLNERGDRAVSEAIAKSLFQGLSTINPSRIEPLRTAVNDKNFYWYQRYRATDGYSTFGDRAFLKFVDDQANYENLQRELEMIDTLTSNRDKVIWSVAQGKPAAADDTNLPPYIDVPTNKPGPLPGGKHVFLGGDEAISKMTVHSNMKVELFASEEQFPELINPVQMSFDTKGRLWVASWKNYPHWKPTEKMDDKLLILEDTNGDGKADVCKTFADNLHNPTGFEFWGGGVLVGCAPNLLFLEDINGDDRVDRETVVVHGLDSADTHHGSNSFTLDPGGTLYFQEGTFHHSQSETPWGPNVRLANAGVFQFEPRTQKFGVYVSFGFANPHGHVFDKWGQDIVVDGTGANPYHGTLFSGKIPFPNKHNRPPQVYQQRTRPCSGIEILSSSHFPEEMRGDLLVANVIGFQGILRYRLQDQDSSFGAVEQEPIVFSSDPNFRPADLEIGPDGAIYFTDWQNPIIGHMQHNLRDPSRDQIHGRVYRVTYHGRDLVKPKPIAAEKVINLLDRLTERDDRVRYRARIELSGRETREVIAATEKWVNSLSPNDPDLERLKLEALWVYQQHNVVNEKLLRTVLASSDFHARSAGVRVLGHWRDRIPSALELARGLASDDHPRVRLEAVRVATFFPEPEAFEVALVAKEKPQDQYLTFLISESLRSLERNWRDAQVAGKKLEPKTPAGAMFLVKNASMNALLKMDRTREVCVEILTRPGVADEIRSATVSQLSQFDGVPPSQVVLKAIHTLDENSASTEPSVIFDLIRQLSRLGPDQLSKSRGELERLATDAKQPVFRQVGFASLINTDMKADAAWQLAERTSRGMIDFMDAVSMVSDPNVRVSLYDRIAATLEQSAKPSESNARKGRYVRIELPRAGTLTLAEVEVYSHGMNVARNGKASQKNTAFEGEASRALDGNTNGAYGSGGQTHTEENTPNPWWEVDLGGDYAIDSVSVFNRIDGELGARLEGFRLLVLDGSRQEVFLSESNPAPKVQVSIPIGGASTTSAIRRAAMGALTQIPGKGAIAFRTLSKFVRDDVDRVNAIHALQKVPRNEWPADEARGLIEQLSKAIVTIPQDQRTTPVALDLLEFADALTPLLPASEAKEQRRRLEDLGVKVVRIGTLFERMAYDREMIVIRAGKPVEFLLENTDMMPHNFVIGSPGSMEELGQIAEASAQKPGFAERFFVPESNKVLLASKLLQPRENQKLSFVAPSAPGVYPYVCTYPGHWRRMHGALYVVPDLDDYQAHPEAYLAENHIETLDPLLKDRRPRTEWKVEELAPLVNNLQSGRSWNTGRQAFQVANCVGCHKLDGAGQQFGPDLAQLEQDKARPFELLKHILEPSAKIDEKYATWTFELKSGKLITGMIVEQANDYFKVIENPLASAKPIEIRRRDIEERLKSQSSIMPKGLLDKLSRDEVLDLIAYVAAKANKDHPLFKGEHDHHHGH